MPDVDILYSIFNIYVFVVHKIIFNSSCIFLYIYILYKILTLNYMNKKNMCIKMKYCRISRSIKYLEFFEYDMKFLNCMIILLYY